MRGVVFSPQFWVEKSMKILLEKFAQSALNLQKYFARKLHNFPKFCAHNFPKYFAHNFSKYCAEFPKCMYRIKLQCGDTPIPSTGLPHLALTIVASGFICYTNKLFYFHSFLLCCKNILICTLHN